MKIEIFDANNQCSEDAQRVQFILDVLNSLDNYQTNYIIQGQHDIPQDKLPVTKVDDVIVKQNEYPSNNDFMTYTGIEFDIMSEEEYDSHHHDGGCSCGHCH